MMPKHTRLKSGKHDPCARGLSKPFHLLDRVTEVVESCREARKRSRNSETPQDLSDETLSKQARFTDNISLMNYRHFLHLLPRLVNVVTLAEAIPVVGSGQSLPLDLFKIASRCNGAYFASKRFSAVQLAYTSPRCRVLVFHTGRLVGTGCGGTMEARLAIARAQRQLAEEASVYIHTRNFQIINTVGAVSLHATLNCEAFADAHTATAHYDQQSFVGLAYRPENEACCVEIYSTGRANLPGARTERSLHESFYRMLPELLRFSSASRLLSYIPESIQSIHRTDGSGTLPMPPMPPMPSASCATSAKFTKPSKSGKAGKSQTRAPTRPADAIDEEFEMEMFSPLQSHPSKMSAVLQNIDGVEGNDSVNDESGNEEDADPFDDDVLTSLGL